MNFRVTIDYLWTLVIEVIITRPVSVRLLWSSMLLHALEILLVTSLDIRTTPPKMLLGPCTNAWKKYIREKYRFNS